MVNRGDGPAVSTWLAALGAGLAAILLAPPVAEAADVTPTGGVGLRYASLFVFDDDALGDSFSRLLINRPEVRLHLGLLAEALDDRVVAEVRLSSGPARRPTDDWQELADFGNLQAVGIDRAWVGLSPDALPELRLSLGLWPVPWSKTGLLFDPDLELPGASLVYARDGGRGALWQRANASVAAVHVSSGQQADDDEIALFAASAGATLGLADGVSLTLDLGYFDLVGARRLGRAIAQGDTGVGRRRDGFTTNTTDTDATTPRDELTRRLINDGLASDFDVLSAFAAARLDALEALPIGLFVHAAYNLGAEGPGEDQALGLAAGLTLGEADRPGRAAVSLAFLHIEADATLALYNKDSWLTNAQGAEVTGTFAFSEGLNLVFEALYTQQIDTDLRGFGDDRGEPASDDPSAVRMRVGALYAF